jgi:hypothetical protein
VLTYKELEKLVCGTKTVDIELLKVHTKFAGDLMPTATKIIWLWEILSEITDEDKIKFIKFCYAQERLPTTHEEFLKNQIRFTIKSSMDKNRRDYFPKADTCFFSLELPEYTSKDIMKSKIVQAINYDNVSINADKALNSDVVNDMGQRDNR